MVTSKVIEMLVALHNGNRLSHLLNNQCTGRPTLDSLVQGKQFFQALRQSGQTFKGVKRSILLTCSNVRSIYL